ncbi:CS domain-containing protein [Cardiosporidium cionae]|uniref:CS domain-containing protein n=1 Tax=Cardiosporidium cionae TaxID=476202 RepID=A0ABQ7J4B6_9APIC|nr:CS domain-containing protein [Cardiosporidium cionae]|eukprot:KAF8817951.1 CS domain-containing protein [Cardiosporidium cionae]
MVWTGRTCSMAGLFKPGFRVLKSPFLMFVLLCFSSYPNFFPSKLLHQSDSSVFSFYTVNPLVAAENVPLANINSSIYSNFISEKDVIFFQSTIGANRPVEGMDLSVTISRAWWNASRYLILKSHEQGFDVSSTVRSTVGIIFSHGEELLRLLNKQHADVIVLSPAFQWAQSLDTIYLSIKFAYRWNSPGALSVEEEKVETFEKNFYFSGIGTHSGVKKKYELDLILFDSVIPELHGMGEEGIVASVRTPIFLVHICALQQTQWNFASVGKMYVELKKASPAIWERMTQEKKKIPNMLIWWDMQEKVDNRRTPLTGGATGQTSESSTSTHSASFTKNADEL